MTKKIEAIIREEKLNDVKQALREIGIVGMNVIEVRGHGRQGGIELAARTGTYYVDMLSKKRRWPSWNKVSNARLDLPEPDGPVTTVKRSSGISQSMPFRLCVRAPRTCARAGPPAGGVAPPPSLLARPPRWPRRTTPLLRGSLLFACCPWSSEQVLTRTKHDPH